MTKLTAVQGLQLINHCLSDLSLTDKDSYFDCARYWKDIIDQIEFSKKGTVNYYVIKKLRRAIKEYYREYYINRGNYSARNKKRSNRVVF